MTADSLAAFLLARWAEIEALTQTWASTSNWEAEGSDVVGLNATIAEDVNFGYAPHIARHDPAYVLADIESKRRIVELYKEERSRVLAYRSPRWKDAMNEQDKAEWHKQEARHRVAEDFALALAQPFADHPDFLEEWKWSNR